MAGKPKNAKLMTDVQVSGDKELQRYWAQLPERLRRTTLRQSLAAGAQLLVTATRTQLKASVSRNASSVGGPIRKYKGVPQKPLAKLIIKKAWSVRKRGILGQTVGPAYVGGRHGHLVERGHEIYPTGRRSVALWFQRRAVDGTKGTIKQRQMWKMAQAIRREHGKAKTKGII